jgi:hypothetical protein
MCPTVTFSYNIFFKKQTNKQVSNWFVNARKRIWHQMLDNGFGRGPPQVCVTFFFYLRFFSALHTGDD